MDRFVRVIGSFIGLIASGFSYAIVWVTSFRQANPMIILGLPLGGLLIVWLYKITGQEKNSGNEPGSDSSPVG